MASIARGWLNASDDELLADMCEALSFTREDIVDVFRKLSTFPHMFELAYARGDLHAYELNGTRTRHS